MRKLKCEEIAYSIVGSVLAVIMFGGLIQSVFGVNFNELIVICGIIFIVTFLIMIKMNLSSE